MNVEWYSPWLRPGVEYEVGVRECDDDKGRSRAKWVTEKTHAAKRSLPGLLPGTLYAVQVRAKNAVGPGPYSPTLVIRTPGDPRVASESAAAARAASGAAKDHEDGGRGGDDDDDREDGAI